MSKKSIGTIASLCLCVAILATPELGAVHATSTADQVRATYNGDDLELSLGNLMITISPSHIQKIAYNLHWITGPLRYEVTDIDYAPIAAQTSPISGTTDRVLQDVPNGVRVTLTGQMGNTANGIWAYTQTITFTNEAILDVTYDVQIVLDQGIHYYFYLVNDTTPLTYRDREITVNYGANVTETIPFGGSYLSPHYAIFPYKDESWRVDVMGGVSWLTLSAWDWSYAIQFVGRSDGFRHLTYDLSQLRELPIWYPLSSHKVIAAAQSILAHEYWTKTDEEIERSVERVAAHADLVEFFTSGGADAAWIPDFTTRFQRYLDVSHQHGLDLAFQTPHDQYPGAWGQSLDNHPEYVAWRLKPNGTFIEARGMATYIDAGGQETTTKLIDITNPQAVNYMAGQFRATLSQIRDLDYVWYDEDVLLRPELDYYDSPTYSDAALEYFRDYLVAKYAPSFADARFPVDEQIPITPANDYKLVYSTDPSYWDKWYEWRAVAFAAWLDAMSQAAAEANVDNLRYKGAVYFCWFEAPWKRLSGVDLDLVLDSPYITWLIMEEAGGYDDYSIPEWQIAEGKRLADDHGKKYGTYVLAYHYYTAPMQNIAPERLVEQIRMGLEYGSQMLVAYNDGPFINRMGDPALPVGGDYIGEYDQTLSNLWDHWRFGYMWELPQLLRPDDGGTTPPSPFLAWSQVPLAVEYQIQIDDDPDFHSPVISTTVESAYLVYRPPSGTLLPGLGYHWRTRAGFTVENKDMWGIVRETFQFWGTFSDSRSFSISTELNYPTVYVPIVFKHR